MTSRNRLRLIILKKFDVLTTKKFVYDPSLQRQHNIIATAIFFRFFHFVYFSSLFKNKMAVHYDMTLWHYEIMTSYEE